MTHLVADKAASEPDLPPGPWLGLSARLTEALDELTDHQGLVVTCAPGAGRGSPACYVPALGSVEIDGALLGTLDPTRVDPRDPADRAGYAKVWGAAVHEVGHAEHTLWRTTIPEGTPRGVVQAAMLLEEARMEAARLAAHPHDRWWLRATVREIVLADLTDPPPVGPSSAGLADYQAGGARQKLGDYLVALTEKTWTLAPDLPTLTRARADGLVEPAGYPAALTGKGRALAGALRAAASEPKPQVAMTPAKASTAAGLLLARADAGILDDSEVEAVETEVAKILGADLLGKLRHTWFDALDTDDHDGQRMLNLGRRWCDLVGLDPDAGDAPAAGPGQPGGDAAPGGEAPSPLDEAVGKALDQVAQTNQGTPAAPKDLASTAEKIATAVFGGYGTGPATNGKWYLGTRAPTAAERAAASRLTRALRAAQVRERTSRTVTSPVPPGRLRMGQVLAADAQRAAGALPSAEPFRRTIRRHTPTPPLRVGIMCDISGSMTAFTGPVASTAWILASAAGHLPDAITASLVFGERLRALTRPGKAPDRVTLFQAKDQEHHARNGIDALDGALELSTRNAARLLVIISDGVYETEERDGGHARLRRLLGTGCGVLWLAPSGTARGRHMVGEFQVLTDPATTIDTIGKAAVRALRPS